MMEKVNTIMQKDILYRQIMHIHLEIITCDSTLAQTAYMPQFLV